MTIEMVIIIALVALCAWRESAVRKWRRKSAQNWDHWQDSLQRCIDSRAKRDKTIAFLHSRIQEMKRDKPKRVVPAIAADKCPLCAKVITPDANRLAYCNECDISWGYDFGKEE